MKFLASVLTVLGTVAATVGSQACLFWFLDEPEMPKSLVK